MSLKTILTQNANARRIFGRKELQIIQKQLNNITLTQSEKNRLSRDIRPKFRFIKELTEFSNEFELKKGTAIEALIAQAVRIMLQDELSSRIHAILLFGSQVEKKATRRSDIDLAVVFGQIDKSEATKFRIRIAGELSEKIDVQVFSLLPQKIKREIARKHKVMYCAPMFDKILFPIHYFKDDGSFFRIKKIFGTST